MGDDPVLVDEAQTDGESDGDRPRRAVRTCSAHGATNTEIATALFLSEATAKTHIGAIFAKLGLRDGAAAIVYTVDHGIVRPPVR